MKLIAGALAIAVVATAALATDANPNGTAAADPMTVPAGTYQLDSSHIGIAARVDHLGFSNVAVRFDKVSGSLNWNPDQPASSSVDIAIDTASLDSGWPARDKHLKSADFFDAEQHPSVSFKANSLDRTGDSTATVPGELTLLGITQPVTLHVAFNKHGKGRRGEDRIGFSAKTSIKRSDFGMKTGLPAVGDVADIAIEAEFLKK